MNHQLNRRAEDGFTLIELLIVMSVILILATLSIPFMNSVIKKAHQASAETSLKDIVTQENVYNSDYPEHGFTCTLAELGGKQGSGPPSPEAAQLIPEDLASGFKAGYTFTITSCSKQTVNNIDQVQSYKITATPTSVGHSGDLGYCTDESGILYRDPKGGTNCTELVTH